MGRREGVISLVIGWNLNLSAFQFDGPGAVTVGRSSQVDAS